MKLKLLIADPDKEWLGHVKAYFVKIDYEVDIADNGKDTQVCLSKGEYFATLMNFNIQDHSGLVVLKFIESNAKNGAVILILNNPEDLEDNQLKASDVHALGVTEILSKPFELETLEEMLEGCKDAESAIKTKTSKSTSSSIEKMTEELYAKVAIGSFYSSKTLLFDVFIKLGESRFLKILNAGDDFSKDRLDHYRDKKNVEFLYIHNKDRIKYIKLCNLIAKEALSKNKISTGVKAKLLNDLTTMFIQEAFTSGINQAAVKEVSKICESVYELVGKQNDLRKLIMDYNEFDPNAYTQAFLVTLFTAAIIKQFKWQTKSTIETAAIACMFIDVGKMEIPKEILDLNIEKMDRNQLKTFVRHPEISCTMLESKNLISPTVKQIIMQHHEANDGSGFPYGKSGANITVLGNIVCLAVTFVEIMLEKDLKPKEALPLLLPVELRRRYKTEVMTNFLKIFTEPKKLNEKHNFGIKI